MPDTDLNMNVGLRVDTSGEELVDRLTRKIKALEASIKSLNSNISRVAKSAVSIPGSVSSSTTAQNQKKQDADAKRSAADLFTFKSRLEAQRQREADRSERYLHRLRVNSFREQERAAAREMTARLTGEARIAREQRTAQADDARAGRAEARSLRDRMSFVTRMAQQRAHEEAASAREQDRSARERIRLDRYRMGLREREDRRLDREASRHDHARAQSFRSGVGNVRSAINHGRESYNASTRTGGAAAAIGVASTASLARRALLAETDIDTAEVNSRIYGGLSKDVARQLRDQWASPLAEKLGVGTAKLISSYVDAIKVGIPNEGARQFSALATQTSEAWGVQFEGVVDILGTVNSILTSTGDAFDFGKLKGVANAIQYLSAKQSTTPDKLISYLQRGAGAAQILGMSQEAGLAFGSASTSLGNQAAESGRLADFVAGRIVSLPDLVKKQGLEGTRARELIRHLGYGSAGDLDRQRRADPDAFLPDFVGRFNAVKDTKKQEQLLKFFAGTEWFGEFGRIVKGFEKYKEAADLAKESKKLDAIGEVWSLHRQKLAFVFKQISSGFLNILGEIGKVLSPMARQVGDFFLEWSRKLQNGGLQARVRAAVEGFIQGLGFKDLPDLLKGIFGEPGQGNAGAIDTWRSTAKAFTEGIRDTLNALKALFSVFTGSNATPETIAKWTARLLTFAAACVIAAPAVAVLSGLASGITALGVAAFGAWKILKAAGLVGAAAGATGAAGKLGNGAAAATGSGLLSTIGRWLGLGAAFSATAGMPKEDSDALMARLGEFAKKRNAEREGSARDWIDPPGRNSIDELKRSIDDNTFIHKQSYESQDGFAGLIRKANLSTSDVAQTVRATIQSNASGIRSGTLSGSISGGVGSSFNGPGSSAPGSALGSVGIGRRGIIGGGGGGGGSGGGGTGIPDSVPMTHEERNTLGLIMKYESGGQNKMNYMGLGQGLHPETAKGYTAQGYFQMLNSNWRRIAPKLGITTPNAMASSLEDQTMVALHLLRNGGIQNWSNYNPKLRAALARGERAPSGSLPPNVGGGSSDAGGGEVLGRMRALRASGQVVNEQCVALAKAAVGVSGSVTTWQKGVGAAEGTLKPGTPLATFLNRDGSQSSRYAGGGVGTMGAKLDHAGVFQSYIRDKNGNIIGMNMAEQYKGSGGVRSKAYYFGQGYGEKNGSNYYAVLGPDGQPLGGSRNPMSAAAQARETPKVDSAGTSGSNGPGGYILGPDNKLHPYLGGLFNADGTRKTASFEKGQNGEWVKKDGPAVFDLEKGQDGKWYRSSSRVVAAARSAVEPGWKPGWGGNAGATNGEMKSTGWQPGFGGNSKLGESTPLAPQRSSPAGSSANSVSAPITINGSNHSPEQIANAVQRRLQESMNRRTHDLDPSSVTGVG